VLDGVGGCFTDRDEQVGNRARGGADHWQPAAHFKADIS
jgi:hypothetical protein